MSTNSTFNGSATISGIAVLENARPASEDTKHKNTIAFDAQLWVHKDLRLDGSPIVAVLKYYNADDKLTFAPDDVGIYFIVANVSKVQNDSSLFSSGMEYSDYSMVGDIVSLIPAGSADDIDPRYRPVVHLSGSVLRNDAKACTFDLAPDQYVWLLRNWTGSRVNFPVRVVVRDSPRWGGKKPNPYPGSNVSLTGFLIGVARNEQGVIEHFEVELEKVTYHGKGSGSVGHSANGSPGAVNTPEKRKMKYSFDSTPTNKRRRLGLECNNSVASTSSTGYAADSETTVSTFGSSP